MQYIPLSADVILSQLRDIEPGAWIGFKLLGDSSWLWVDNSHVGYTNWDTGEPSVRKAKIYSRTIFNLGQTVYKIVQISAVRLNLKQ